MSRRLRWVNGHVRSCGCLLGEVTSKRNKLRDIGSDERAKRDKLVHYKQTAVDRKLAWELDTPSLTLLLAGNCEYCGEPPSNIHKDPKNKGGHFRYNGIDRMDNSKGYIFGNVVSCCKRCNIAKNNMTKEEFLSLVKRVYERNFP